MVKLSTGTHPVANDNKENRNEHKNPFSFTAALAKTWTLVGKRGRPAFLLVRFLQLYRFDFISLTILQTQIYPILRP